MPSRLRRFTESILYAGLKPDAPRRGPKRDGLAARLGRRFARLLAGRAPADPLYISRRTWKQKLRLTAMIGIPCLALAGALALAIAHLFPGTAAPPPEPTPAEIVARLLPDLDKRVKIESNRDAEVVEVRAARGPNATVAGLLRNKTDRPISVELTLDLTDGAGSQLGAVVGRIDNAPAKNDARFEFPIRQTNAAFAIVREIRTLR